MATAVATLASAGGASVNGTATGTRTGTRDPCCGCGDGAARARSVRREPARAWPRGPAFRQRLPAGADRGPEHRDPRGRAGSTTIGGDRLRRSSLELSMTSRQPRRASASSWPRSRRSTASSRSFNTSESPRHCCIRSAGPSASSRHPCFSARRLIARLPLSTVDT